MRSTLLLLSSLDLSPRSGLIARPRSGICRIQYLNQMKRDKRRMRMNHRNWYDFQKDSNYYALLIPYNCKINPYFEVDYLILILDFWVQAKRKASSFFLWWGNPIINLTMPSEAKGGQISRSWDHKIKIKRRETFHSHSSHHRKSDPSLFLTHYLNMGFWLLGLLLAPSSYFIRSLNPSVRSIKTAPKESFNSTQITRLNQWTRSRLKGEKRKIRFCWER